MPNGKDTPATTETEVSTGSVKNFFNSLRKFRRRRYRKPNTSASSDSNPDSSSNVSANENATDSSSSKQPESKLKPFKKRQINQSEENNNEPSSQSSSSEPSVSSSVSSTKKTHSDSNLADSEHSTEPSLSSTQGNYSDTYYKSHSSELSDSEFKRYPNDSEISKSSSESKSSQSSSDSSSKSFDTDKHNSDLSLSTDKDIPADILVEPNVKYVYGIRYTRDPVFNDWISDDEQPGFKRIGGYGDGWETDTDYEKSSEPSKSHQSDLTDYDEDEFDDIETLDLFGSGLTYSTDKSNLDKFGSLDVNLEQMWNENLGNTNGINALDDDELPPADDMDTLEDTLGNLSEKR